MSASGRTGTTHETFHRDEQVIGPSARTFGLLAASVCAAVALLPMWSGRAPRLWAAALALGFLGAALLVPRLLAPLNALWLRVGLVLHRVVNPVIMAALFYGVVTPFGIVTRVFRREAVRRLRPDPTATSYWIDRTGHPPAAMEQQF